jgi:hypothetical protein
MKHYIGSANPMHAQFERAPPPTRHAIFHMVALKPAWAPSR